MMHIVTHIYRRRPTAASYAQNALDIMRAIFVVVKMVTEQVYKCLNPDMK